MRSGMWLVIGWLASFSVTAAETVKIGIAGPFTGAYAAFGEQQWRGAEQAAKDINAAGGIKGRMVELVKADDACEPRQAVAIANRLTAVDKVTAVIGHFCSSSTLPASEIYADADILMITHGSTNPKVTERKLNNVLRMCGRDDQQGSVAAEFILNTLGGKRIAVLHDKDTYGQGLADAMRTRLQQLGSKTVLYEGLTRGEKDFNALVTKLRGVNADVVYFGGLHSEAGPLVRQMREQGLKAHFVSGDGIVSKDLAAAAGGPQYLEGVMMTFGADSRKIPAGQKLVTTFRQAGYEPEGYTLYAYAAMQAISAALQANTTPSGAKLGAWLQTHPVDTVMGRKSWDAKGDLSVSDYVLYRWDAQGNYSEVTP